MHLYVHKFDESLITFLKNGDWIDLSSSKTVEYKKDDYVLIPLGFSMKLPEGYEAHLLPRSSTFKKYGLLHASSGIIDNAYCGDADEWLFGAYATRDGVVSRGERVCQFRIVKNMPQVEIVFVNLLSNPNRGGHGSTGY